MSSRDDLNFHIKNMSEAIEKYSIWYHKGNIHAFINNMFYYASNCFNCWFRANNPLDFSRVDSIEHIILTAAVRFYLGHYNIDTVNAVLGNNIYTIGIRGITSEEVETAPVVHNSIQEPDLIYGVITGALTLPALPSATYISDYLRDDNISVANRELIARVVLEADNIINDMIVTLLEDEDREVTRLQVTDDDRGSAATFLDNNRVYTANMIGDTSDNMNDEMIGNILVSEMFMCYS